MIQASQRFLLYKTKNKKINIYKKATRANSIGWL